MRELVVFALLLGACGGRVNEDVAQVPDAADTSVERDTSIAIDTTIAEAGTDSADTLDAREASACDAGSGTWVSRCANGIDDDGDGLIDWLDPECTSRLDQDESSFALGIPTEFDPCKTDCFFDGNSGSGDDGCAFDGKCIVGTTDPRCPYDPAAAADPTRCPAMPEKCVNYCTRLTPNGCDCAGCCDVFDATGASKRVRLAEGCTVGKLNDPSYCPTCEKRVDCQRPCGRCDYCIGKTKLPPDCTDEMRPACPAGAARCSPDKACPCGEFCLNGCCVGP